jgi:hypothetical protein
MPDDAHLPELLKFRRQEELTKLRRRTALEKLEEAKEKVEVARVGRENSDEVARAMRH